MDSGVASQGTKDWDSVSGEQLSQGEVVNPGKQPKMVFSQKILRECHSFQTSRLQKHLDSVPVTSFSLSPHSCNRISLRSSGSPRTHHVYQKWPHRDLLALYFLSAGLMTCTTLPGWVFFVFLYAIFVALS